MAPTGFELDSLSKASEIEEEGLPLTTAVGESDDRPSRGSLVQATY
jgi:hypothetical protein